MNDIITRLIAFPSTVKAVTVPDENGDYNIYINKNLCHCQQQLAIEHELEHIRNCDFESYFDVAVLEKRVVGKIG